MLSIIVDENIPAAQSLLDGIATVHRLPGRSMSNQDLIDLNADALMVRSITQVNEALLANTSVKFVGTCTIGLDHIDQTYLAQQGIGFSNAPGCNADAVVDYVMACLMSQSHEARLTPDLRESFQRDPLAFWQSKTLGIVGVGEVGSRLQKRAQGIGMRTACYDPFKDEHDFQSVLASDVISLHTPLTTAEHSAYPTKAWFNKKLIKQLPGNTLLINAARGKIINNDDLLQELDDSSRLNNGAQQGLLAVLDVYEQEPSPSDALLERIALTTGHIAGYSVQGKLRGTQMIVEKLLAHFSIEANVHDALAETKTIVAVNESDSLLSILRQAYNIDEDANHLKQLLLGLSDEDKSQAFDAFRKNYPQRHEFAFTQITGANPKLHAYLKALGFTVND